MKSGDAMNDGISELIPLRVSDDLTLDEQKAVDELVRYNETAKAELAAYTKLHAIFERASGAPLPVDRHGGLWNRIESRLGPAGRARRFGVPSHFTYQLAAACVVLGAVTLAMYWNGAATPVAPFVGRQENLAPVDLSVLKPMLGVGVQDLSAGIAKKLGIHSTVGALIADVLPGSAASEIGLEPGDVIIGVDNLRIHDAKELALAIQQLRPGQRVVLDVIRQGKAFQIEVLLGARRSSMENFDRGWPAKDLLLPDWEQAHESARLRCA